MGGAKSCSIMENIMLDRYYEKQYCRGGILKQDEMRRHAEQLISEFAIKVPNSEYALGTLSGGNMQKVILAREMDADPELLIAASRHEALTLERLNISANNWSLCGTAERPSS